MPQEDANAAKLLVGAHKGLLCTSRSHKRLHFATWGSSMFQKASFDLLNLKDLKLKSGLLHITQICQNEGLF